MRQPHSKTAGRQNPRVNKPHAEITSMWGGLQREMRSDHDTGRNVLRRDTTSAVWHVRRYVHAFLIDSRRSGMRSKIIASFSRGREPLPPTARSADLLERFERSENEMHANTRIHFRISHARRFSFGFISALVFCRIIVSCSHTVI